MQRRQSTAQVAAVHEFSHHVRRYPRNKVLGPFFDGLRTLCRRLRATIWISLHNATRASWKIQSDLQDLALFLDKHGAVGPQILAGRARRCAGRRDRAHWKRLHRMLEGCEFGLLPDPMTRVFLYLN